jgi:hypothetical protein
MTKPKPASPPPPPKPTAPPPSRPRVADFNEAWRFPLVLLIVVVFVAIFGEVAW